MTDPTVDLGLNLASTTETQHYTFLELVTGREDEFPTLALAAQRTHPARDVEVIWLAGGSVGIWRNYQQIFRYPYQHPVPEGSAGEGGDDLRDKALTDFLAQVDTTLESGHPSDERASLPMPIRTCGGYRHYLGRDLKHGDVLTLRPLREPMLRVYHWWYIQGEWTALDSPKYEWLAETSLQVVPAEG